MGRTSTTLVQQLLEGGGPNSNYDGATDLQQFIDSATTLVDAVVTLANNKGSFYNNLLTSSSLEIIERWLAAHFYTMYDQMMQSKTTAGASASFQGTRGPSISSTTYGQTAINLDPTGCLAAISNRQFAQAFGAGDNCNWGVGWYC